MGAATPKCASTGFLQSNKNDAQETTKIKIRAALFFDGTLNNEVNTTLGATKTKAFITKNGSYGNDYTNVVFLKQNVNAGVKAGYDYYLEPIYTEGIGTNDREEDDSDGYISGTGLTGIKAKVDKAFETLKNTIKKEVSGSQNNNVEITELRLDVFGFSRGAAAARHFVDVALNGLKTVIYRTAVHGPQTITMTKPNLADRLKFENYKIEKQAVKIKFVGLFDTVSSLNLEDIVSENSNVGELGLDAISNAEKVFHIASAEETRQNFALTNIKSAGSKGKEVFLPGVHSDIGGSYNDYEIEKIQVYDTDVIYITDSKYKEIEADINSLIKAGWFRREDIFYKDGSRHLRSEEDMKKAVNSNGEINIIRRGSLGMGIRNRYSRIPLQLMAEKATEGGVTFYPKISKSADTFVDTSIPIMREAWLLLKGYINGASKPEDWQGNTLFSKSLRFDHLHFSAKYDEAYAVGVKIPFTNLHVEAVPLAPNKPRYEDTIRKRKHHDG